MPVNNNPNGLSQIEDEIKHELEKIRDNYRLLEQHFRNNRWITNEIKERIGALANGKGFLPLSTKHDGEWLYDLIWYKETDDFFLEKTILALESELCDRSIAGLKYDFEKLLLSNSDYRVMICFGQGNYGYPANVNNLIDIFDKCVNAYKYLPVGSRVLVLIWEDFTTDDILPHLIIKN